MNVKAKLPLSRLREVVEDSVCIAQLEGKRCGLLRQAEGSKKLDGPNSSFYLFSILPVLCAGSIKTL